MANYIFLRSLFFKTEALTTRRAGKLHRLCGQFFRGRFERNQWRWQLTDCAVGSRRTGPSRTWAGFCHTVDTGQLASRGVEEGLVSGSSSPGPQVLQLAPCCPRHRDRTRICDDPCYLSRPYVYDPFQLRFCGGHTSFAQEVFKNYVIREQYVNNISNI